jgi:4-alpha-glucanotransferase
MERRLDATGDKLMAAEENFGAPEKALARLAAHFGIEPVFRDARGKDVVTTPETQKRLLAAMGVVADSERNCSMALDRERSADAQPPLPPVLVVHSADGCCCVEMALAHDARRITWRIELEDGTERRGVAELARPGSEASGASQQWPRLELGELPWGYHRLHLPEFGASTALIFTPGQCWLPDALREGAGLWGISAQLYLLRSEQNWGIGDFTDLAKLVEVSGQRGCEIIGLNPLHQMMLDIPEQVSPYSPLTRLYLNVLYIAVPDAPGYSSSVAVRKLVESPKFQARLAACQSAANVDYTAVVSLKLEALRILYAAFNEGISEHRQRFVNFRHEKGVSLRRTSVFQALRQYFAAEDPSLADWHNWPEEYRSSTSEAVERFAQEHTEEIDFLTWLQWVADEQLAHAADAADSAGMAIGLYRDLAVGCDRSGSETWTNPEAFLVGVQVGAPPDIFNPAGQDWGLPPFHPTALRDEAYVSFIELIRANMRHAGGLRIDHVMGLQHLYCIPEGCSPAQGAYVGYPLEDLVGILALESHRHRCLVVGEDLGTVPQGFREKMAAANILSYRVLFFEQNRDHGGFLPPEEYPRLALAVAGSHDLPTLVGWWEARDIDLKERLGLYPSENEVVAQRQRREQDRASILKAFQKESLLESHGDVSAEQFAIAAHEFLARSGSALVIAQLDDLLGEVDQVNVPATFLEHPNWRRKYSMTLEEITSGDDAWRQARRLLELRQGDYPV